MQKSKPKCIISASLSKKREDETNSEYLERIKNEFLYNVNNKKYYFKNKEIRFAKWKRPVPTEDNPNNFEVECFHHTITSLDEDHNPTRQFDPERYQKCLLAFVILDKCSCDHIKCQLLTVKPDSKNAKRATLYCDRYNYVVVLEEKENHYKYITSFPVSDRNVVKYR